MYFELQVCGKTFEYNSYLTREKGKYDKHVENHNVKCRTCGETFPTAAARKYHQVSFSHLVTCANSQEYFKG